MADGATFYSIHLAFYTEIDHRKCEMTLGGWHCFLRLFKLGRPLHTGFEPRSLACLHAPQARALPLIHVIYSLIMLCFEILLSYPSNNVERKMFGSLLVINYFANYWLDYIFNGFYATRKIIQMFSVFSVFTHTHTHTHTHPKIYVNLYQKELIGCFSEGIKMWPCHNVLNLYTSNWLLQHLCRYHGP